MRVTTQMLNKSAARAGISRNGSSLLNFINRGSNNNAVMQALNKKNTAVNTENKKKYETLEKESEKLAKSTDTLMKEGEKSLFSQAKESGDNQKVYDEIKSFLDTYNNNITALKNVPGSLNDFYRQMLSEAAEDDKEKLAKVGVTFAKDGVATVDMEKMKASDFDSLEKLFGNKSDFVNRANILSKRVLSSADATLKSFGNGYSSSGNLYTGNAKSKYDFRR